MLQEAIDKILAIAEPKIIEHGERTFSSHPIKEIKPPKQASFAVNTLTGLVDYLGELEGEHKQEDLIIHVQGHDQVFIMSKVDKLHYDRHYLIHAKTDPNAQFSFGDWLEAEDFAIALQTSFIQTEAVGKILHIVGNMKQEQVTISKDDGHTQSVDTREGVALAGTADIPNPVILQPYRTFCEVDQPESLFVFRVKNNPGGLPLCSLHDADGGRWKLDAIQKISAYLKEKVPTFKILA